MHWENTFNPCKYQTLSGPDSPSEMQLDYQKDKKKKKEHKRTEIM